MSWPKQHKAILRVTKFAPDTAKPVAGLPPQVREELRAKREAETRRIEPAVGWVELRKDYNIFMYGNFVEFVDCRPDPADCIPGPPEPRPPYDELYVKQKKMRDAF